MPETVQDERFSAKLELFSQADAGAEISGLTLGGLSITDWSNARAVAVRLHNPTDREQEIGMRLLDGTGGSHYYRRERFPAGATNTLYVEIDEVNNYIDPCSVLRMSLFTYRAEATQVFLAGPVCLVT